MGSNFAARSIFMCSFLYTNISINVFCKFLGKMDNSHRLFLQCFVAKPFMSEGDAKATYTKCVKEDCDQESFDRFVAVINRSLRTLFLEIRKRVSDDDGKNYYGLVNGSEDQISKFATNYTPHDVDFFRKVMDLIVQSDNGTVTSVELLHGAQDLEKPMSASHAENLLHLWKKDKWISQSSGNCWLGPRAVLELHPYLKKVYSDFIVDCKICMDIVLKGQNCVACDVRLHDHCAARYFRGREIKKCPDCSMDWLHNASESVSDTDETAPRPSQNTSIRHRPKRTR